MCQTPTLWHLEPISDISWCLLRKWIPADIFSKSKHVVSVINEALSITTTANVTHQNESLSFNLSATTFCAYYNFWVVTGSTSSPLTLERITQLVKTSTKYCTFNNYHHTMLRENVWYDILLYKFRVKLEHYSYVFTYISVYPLHVSCGCENNLDKHSHQPVWILHVLKNTMNILLNNCCSTNHAVHSYN